MPIFYIAYDCQVAECSVIVQKQKLDTEVNIRESVVIKCCRNSIAVSPRFSSAKNCQSNPVLKTNAKAIVDRGSNVSRYGACNDMPAKTAALSGLGLVAPRYLVFAKLKNTLVVDFKRGGERLSCLLGARVAPESKLFKQSGRICAPKGSVTLIFQGRI